MFAGDMLACLKLEFMRRRASIASIFGSIQLEYYLIFLHFRKLWRVTTRAEVGRTQKRVGGCLAGAWGLGGAGEPICGKFRGWLVLWRNMSPRQSAVLCACALALDVYQLMWSKHIQLLVL